MRRYWRAERRSNDAAIEWCWLAAGMAVLALGAFAHSACLAQSRWRCGAVLMIVKALRLLPLILTMSCSGGRDDAFTPLQVGDRAPAYAVRTLTGDTVRVGAGIPILLNVWATWCTSCREELHDLETLEARYRSRGVRLLAVSVDAGDGMRVRRFVEAGKISFTVAHDPAGEVQRAFHAVGVPETYLISGDGRLVWARRGGFHESLERLRYSLDSAVAQLR